MARLLLTRPADDSAALARELAARGVDTVISPLLHIERVAYTPPAPHPDALLLTSRHAAYACMDFPGVPVYAVGAQTAEAAVAAGCGGIRAVAPDAAHLLPMLPAQERMLYLSGEHIRCDFPNTARCVVYRAQAAETLTPEAAAALRDGTVDGVAFFSPRTAEIFHTLTLPSATAHLTAFCLSPAVAEACAANGRWQRIETAAEPTRQAMLTLLCNAK